MPLDTTPTRPQIRRGNLAPADLSLQPGVLALGYGQRQLHAGVPAAAGQNSLIGSLAYAALPGAQPTPIPAAADWPSLTSGASQTVTGLTTSVDPAWTSQIAQRWQPTDPRMTVIDITGTLTVTAPGHPPARHLISVSLMLGTALHQLAVELAQERRRATRLERELAQLRAARAPSVIPDEPAPDG